MFTNFITPNYKHRFGSYGLQVATPKLLLLNYFFNTWVEILKQIQCAKNSCRYRDLRQDWSQEKCQRGHRPDSDSILYFAL